MNHLQPIADGNSAITLCRLAQDSRGTETILLVEDEPFVLQSTFEILKSAGYRVLKAANAEEARTTFRCHGDEVQLLLTDVILPDQNGQDLAADLRVSNPALRVIFVSGYPQKVSKELMQGGVFYMAKPFSAESLLRKVWLAMEHRLEGIAI